MTELTQADRDLFRRAIGVWNRRDLITADAATQLDAGDDLVGDRDVVTVRHETVAGMAAVHSQPGYSAALDGRDLHVWQGVQMAKGRARGNLFFMAFDGVSAGYFTGQPA